jgi:hypothetical protein
MMPTYSFGRPLGKVSHSHGKGHPGWLGSTEMCHLTALCAQRAAHHVQLRRGARAPGPPCAARDNAAADIRQHLGLCCFPRTVFLARPPARQQRLNRPAVLAPNPETCSTVLAQRERSGSVCVMCKGPTFGTPLSQRLMLTGPTDGASVSASHSSGCHPPLRTDSSHISSRGSCPDACPPACTLACSPSAPALWSAHTPF